MEGMTTFTSDKESLQDVLKAISIGTYQLPEFQRGWVWDDAHIMSLLASVSLSYPIGAVMMLENGNKDVRFKPRPVEGVELALPVEPERFILDGQQRLTSLYQAIILNRAVKTKDIRKKEILRWYYIDMVKALNSNGDREDAIKSLPEDRKIKNFRNEIVEDYSTPEAEFEHMLFPLSLVLDCAKWRANYNKHWSYDPQKTEFFDTFERAVVDRFKQYQIPVIKLLKETPKVAVCQVFEKVNTGGVSLTVFELVTATFAADGYNLREDWEGKHNERGHKIASGRKDRIHSQIVLRSIGADELLQVISLLSAYSRKKEDSSAAVGCKRTDILKLKLDDYKKWVELATSGFEKAGRFIFQQKIFSNKDVPYGTQLVPLAAILAIIGDKADTDLVREKLGRWYWCGVFGELYGSAVETRFARDVVEVMNWVSGGQEPSTVSESNFSPGRFDTLRTRNSAAYKGLYALLMQDGCLDFRTGEPIQVQTYFADIIDIHHIFPHDWCVKKHIESKYSESIVNKTALSYRTNRIIGGNAPSQYLKALRDKCSIAEKRQDQILVTHLIDPETLKKDDFKSFYDKRKEALLKRIEQATGKAIGRQAPSQIENADAEGELTEEEEQE
ncbi:DUF262 domain-containing protein [Candidatus Dehalogenimonas loeffleri]|uniref:DUF262 domain-containing protein n=1 Tax=Candidatus Dehalogenimonas loeffleri TaxID=3127115 RepID=A0ABZ2J6I5_9CHLR